MAQIIPKEFADKSKQELYEDIVSLSAYVTKLRRDIEDLQAHLKLQNGEMIKKRGENLKLKSHIGHQNIKIQQLNDDKSNIIDVDFKIPEDNE